MNVTIFKNIRATSAGFHRSVDLIFDRIRNGNSKKLLDRIRDEADQQERNKLKSELPSICFSGTFKYRNEQGLIKHSGLICIDFDHFTDAGTAKTWRDTIEADQYTYAIFTSPSGDGLKVLVRIPPDPAKHKAHFDALCAHWDCEFIDRKTSDVCRVCYESYDPNLYVNPDSLTWDTTTEPDEESLGYEFDKVSIPMASENGIISRLETWFNRKYGMTKGGRNANIYRFANALNTFGIAEHVAEQYLIGYAQKDFTETEIRRTIKSAYTKAERHATRFFEDATAKQKVEKLIRAGKKADEIGRLVPQVAGKVDEAITNIKETMSVTDFWTYTENGKVMISPHQYKFFLEQNQFCKFYPEGSAAYVFVKIESNLLEDTVPTYIKDFILKHLLERPDVGFGPYDYMANQTRLFKEDYLNLLQTVDVTLKKDTEGECYLYFKNCALRITSSNIEQIDYVDLDGFVWRKHVIEREYHPTNATGGMFERFVHLIAGGSDQRFNSLRSVAGYLMHSFKTGANNKAIVFNDEAISDNPNGGSGKGLFCQAIGQMKRISNLDGKQFSFEKSFPYQTVGADTQVLVFDDVRKNFAFEQLFSLITEGITLEKKNKDAIYIPVSRSPKLVINTNYTIGGVGGSFERRKFEVELSSHFGAHHTPFDEFGRMLFDDWNASEWDTFHAFMIGCVQYYLVNGLVKHEFNNLALRKYIKETSSEFVEWANPETVAQGQRLDKSVLFNHFIDEYNDLKKWLTQRKFTSWLESYGKHHAVRVTQGKSNGLRWICVGDQTTETDNPPF